MIFCRCLKLNLVALFSEGTRVRSLKSLKLTVEVFRSAETEFIYQIIIVPGLSLSTYAKFQLIQIPGSGWRIFANYKTIYQVHNYKKLIYEHCMLNKNLQYLQNPYLQYQWWLVNIIVSKYISCITTDEQTDVLNDGRCLIRTPSAPFGCGIPKIEQKVKGSIINLCERLS